MSVKSRVPDNLTDDRSMRSFLDALDRKHVKTGQIEDLDGAATTSEIVTALNALLAIYRER